jgi:hypothetical protein
VSQDYIQRFVRGEPVELHQVMAAAKKRSSRSRCSSSCGTS